jgi:hypothetical protein
MTPTEMSDALAEISARLATLGETNPATEWGRGDVDRGIEVWNRLDRLMADVATLRRQHAVTLGHRIGKGDYLALTRDGTITVHRETETNHQWDGHAVLGELAQRLADMQTGDIVEAIPLDVARAVIPACGQGAVSSKWKVTELRKAIPDAETRLHKTKFGDAMIARGPGRQRNSKPPQIDVPNEEPPAHEGHGIDNVVYEDHGDV